MARETLGKTERIEIIDDNMNDVQLMRRILERSGYTVEFASNGEEGLALARNFIPDCILVDFRMPGMDGYEVCRHIKADPLLQSIPVLMLTGAEASRNLVDGLESGADDFVTKSSDMEVIMARVRALLRVKAYQDRIVEQAEQMRRLYDEIKQKSDKIMALNQRLNSDLQFARRVQEALLPQPSFQSAGIDVRPAYIPSEVLSGDFYDYFSAGEAFYLFMGDVSGHGLPAAILVSLLKSYLHSEAQDSPSLPQFMSRLNDFLFSASLPNQYATAQFFRYDPAARELVISNAAHPPFLLLRKKEGKGLAYEQPGHLLGAMPGMPFDDMRLQIAAGDILFCYTDGLTDRREATGDFYSIERINRLLEQTNGESLATIYDALYADVTNFAQTEDFRDDIAFVLTRFS